MPKYQAWLEVTEHYLHQVDAATPEEARELILTNKSWCVDSQETHFVTDVELIEDNKFGDAVRSRPQAAQ